MVKSSNYFICCKISKTLLKTAGDVYICTVYIPPETFKYFNHDLLEDLAENILSFSVMGHLILMGDFNARTATENDFVPQEGNTFVPLCTQKYLDEPKRRFSFDNIINNHGKWLLDLCRTLDLRILNGRVKGNSFGH